MPRAHYSDEQKAEALAALAANGGNVARTAEQIGVPASTLTGWRDAPDRAAPTELRDQKRGGLADRMDDLAHSILDVLPDKLDAASAKDLATSLGIAIDKVRLLRGESTAITETRDTGAKHRVADKLSRLASAQRN